MNASITLRVHFVGPFAWPDLPDAPSVFRTEEGRKRGIYLWTAPARNGHLVYYVGETGRSFRDRFLEHYKEHTAGFYHLYSPEEFVRGEKVEVWPGRYDPVNKKSVAECIANYSVLAPTIAAVTATYRFFLAPLEVEDRMRQRVEAALAGAFAALPGTPGLFQDKGIRYRPRRPAEEPVSCLVTASADVVGLPMTVVA